MFVRLSCCMLLVLCASGCATSLVYDENRDQQAQATVKAVEEAHLTATVASLDKTFADMAAREEASAQERAGQLFDWELLRVSRARTLASRFEDSDTDVDGLATSVEARLVKLGLRDTTTDTLRELRTHNVDASTDRLALADKQAAFLGSFGVAFSSCAGIYAASTDPDHGSETPSQRFLDGLSAERRATAGLQFAELVQNCHSIEARRGARDILFKRGLVGALLAQVAQQRQDLAAYDKAHAKALDDLDAVKQAARPAQDATTVPESDLAKVQAAANRILAIFDDARKASAEAGLEVEATERLERLEALVGAIAGTPSDGKVKLSENDLVTVEIVKSLPALADEARTLLAEAKKPRLVPYLAAIDYQKLALARIEDDIAIRRKQADALESELQAYLNESLALARILQPIQEKNWGDRSLDALLKDVKATDSPADDRTLYTMLSLYADQVRQLRIDEAVWKSRALAAVYEGNLSDSKYAAQQWDTLMDMTAHVLADYHASGIKPDDINEFFKALGLVAIGVGVAQ